jgi:hypothetical protein
MSLSPRHHPIRSHEPDLLSLSVNVTTTLKQKASPEFDVVDTKREFESFLA